MRSLSKRTSAYTVRGDCEGCHGATLCCFSEIAPSLGPSASITLHFPATHLSLLPQQNGHWNWPPGKLMGDLFFLKDLSSQP